MNIRLPERFSVEWMLNHIRTSSYGLPYRFVGKRVLRRPLWLGGAPAVAEFDLSRAGTMGVRLVPRSGRAARRSKKDSAMLDELAAQSRFLWGLDDNAEGHQRAMAADTDLAALFERFGALRIVRAPDLYEALLVAVIGQQVSVQSAQSTRRRLMHNLGTALAAGSGPGGEDHYLYPTPRQLREAGERGAARAGDFPAEVGVPAGNRRSRGGRRTRPRGVRCTLR